MAEDTKAITTTTQPQGRTLKEWLTADNFKKAVKDALPKHMDATRFIQVAITATTKIPKLRQCTPESVLKCLIDLSSVGLEPDGRHAHLIPFGAECQLILDYRGIATLVRRSGEVAAMHCDVVREGDEFDFKYGTGAFLTHKPNLEDADRLTRQRKAVYSYVRFKDGAEDFLVWGMSNVESIKARSKGAKSKDSPWSNGIATDFDAMAAKSVFRSHSKWLPWSSAEVRRALHEIDHDAAVDVEFNSFELPEGGSAEAAKAVAEAKKAELRKASDVAASVGIKPEAEDEKREPDHIDAILAYRERISPEAFRLIMLKHKEINKLEDINSIPLGDPVSALICDLEEALVEARKAQGEIKKQPRLSL